MAEMLVSIAVEQLISISLPVIQQEARRGFGVKKEVEKLSTTLNDILAVLRDSEEKQVRNEPVKVWLEDLKYVAYDIDDVCDEWRTRNSISHIEGVHSALISKKKVCSYFSPCFGFNRVILRRDIGRRIKDIWERLDVIDKKKNQFNFTSRSIEEPVRYETSSVITSLEICGREEDSDIITSKLLGRGKEEEERMEGVIDGIQPHPDLEKLAIQNYPGTKLPKNWLMSDDGLVVSSNLVSLKLRGCINCMQLPSSLGKLPSLQELGLGEMNAVTNVDHEFFGFRDADDRLLFPKLTRLSFTDSTNWEEWDMITRFKDDDISIMPRLSSLILIDCPKLKALPYHFLQNRTLQKLWIFRCSVLEELCQMEVGKDWSKISHIPDIEINRVKIQSTS
ncbi:hypothetical protein HHK36_001158 [Tetracentron sinense]|uniref:Rx N-terminal domain-containing protein n=1 Tax=Tetracentron sinense TaxID=13715 RepID=A0A835A356_TETSI|nr:hypothetical protein HHK36_001158 [Tetracentron sinense]